MNNELLRLYQTEVPTNNGLWTVRSLSTSSPSNNDLLETYNLDTIETLPPPFYIKGTCFEEMGDEVLITTKDELFLYLCEVLIRFDADPKHYQKEDYAFLIKMLIKSLIFLYDQIENHTQEISDLWTIITNITVEGGISTAEDITSMLPVGAISAQEVIPRGSTLDDFIKQLVLTTFYPTFTPLTYSLTSNSANIVESGTTSDLLLTVNFNRGSINGNLNNGIWNPSLFQNYRSGEVTNIIIDEIDKNTNTTHTIYANQIVDGSNTYTSTITYATGPQPLDSAGNHYSTREPAAIVAPTLTIQGKRKAFYGVSSLTPTNTTIRNLPLSYLNPNQGTVLTINVPIGATNINIAIPTSIGLISSIIYVEAMNTEIIDIFQVTMVYVAGANDYEPAQYYLYNFQPVNPITQFQTFLITI